MLPYVRPPGGCKLDAFNNFLLFRLFCPSFLFGCCIFSRISAGFCQGEFSLPSARSLREARARVPPLVDVAGSRDATWPDRLRGGAHASFARYAPLRRPVSQKQEFRFLCNFFAIADSLLSFARWKWAAARPICHFFGLRPCFGVPRQSAIAKKLQFWAYFCFWTLGSASCQCYGRGAPGAAPLWTTLDSVVGVGRLGGAVRGMCLACDAGGWMFRATRCREWSGPGATLRVALDRPCAQRLERPCETA